MRRPPESCECVIWRDGSRRCELWYARSGNRLRVYEGDRLLHEEPFVNGAGWSRALELRTIEDPAPPPGTLGI